MGLQWTSTIQYHSDDKTNPAEAGQCIYSKTGAIIGALFIWAIPGENKDIVVYMAGQVSGILTLLVTYWVGSTRASANKNSLIRR